MNRLPTGIQGFDDLIEGGLPEFSATLLLGSYGTGKSIFGLEYLYNGAKQHGDVGVYVTFEQHPEALRNQAKQMGYDKYDHLVHEGKISVMSIPADKVNHSTEQTILDQIKEKGAKRVVIDSLSALSINAPVYSLAQKELHKDGSMNSQIIQSAINYEDLKKDFVYGFIRKLKESGATSLLISEIEDGTSVDKVSEYVADGVITLKKTSVGEEINRTVHFDKLRFTNIQTAMKEFTIDNGLDVKH
ncbi:MAG: RAD55 family ATPase [Nanoarchaeota archaeon]